MSKWENGRVPWQVMKEITTFHSVFLKQFFNLIKWIQIFFSIWELFQKSTTWFKFFFSRILLAIVIEWNCTKITRRITLIRPKKPKKRKPKKRKPKTRSPKTRGPKHRGPARTRQTLKSVQTNKVCYGRNKVEINGESVTVPILFIPIFVGEAIHQWNNYNF